MRINFVPFFCLVVAGLCGFSFLNPECFQQKNCTVLFVEIMNASDTIQPNYAKHYFTLMMLQKIIFRLSVTKMVLSKSEKEKNIYRQIMRQIIIFLFVKFLNEN